jgi:flagellar biosynthetic protein FlhB
LLGFVAWTILSKDLSSVMILMNEPVNLALPHALKMAAKNTALMVGSLLFIALLDVPYQLWSHARKLRMSLEDVKKEHKDSDGDPKVKAQIRRRQMQMAKSRMMADVPKADIIVTNPTHFAVALKYLDKGMRAPRVVAKGTDLVALRIRAMAQEHGIPILEAPPLTRALYKHTRLGDEVPEALYSVVAEVLAWAYQLKRQSASGGDAPDTPKNLLIPEELSDQGSR